ncbi:MAG: hypothetical protein AB1305_01970 [Candidatus Hadarchaeota archaeon]
MQMLDLYECPRKHRFLRAPGGQEESIPCAYCMESAKLAGRFEENRFESSVLGSSLELLRGVACF